MSRNKADLWFITGFSMAALSLALAVRYRQGRILSAAWQARRRNALDVLACPACHSTLSLEDLPSGSTYHCTACGEDYPLVKGIGQFIRPSELSGMNKTFSFMYDWFSWTYRLFSKIAFVYIGMPEEQARREVTDRLDPQGGSVLEVSIGPGVNLPYLVNRSDVGYIYGLDISQGQLNRCRDYVARQGWDIQLDLGNAECLPYQDNIFAGVFHIGGINFFNDKGKAITEMIRVAKPGARILIADETEAGAQGYERFLPGFKRSFNGQREVIQPPVDLIPGEMMEVRVFDIWKGWFYCLEFRKP